MERKIGEIFEHEGEWYQCVENTIGACWNCDLRRLSCDDVAGECSHTIRDDKKNICFKKLEKVGEPHWIRKRLMQPYELFTKAVTPLGLGCFSIWHQDLTIEIEIKQNQENMEEKKSNLKPFSLEAAKAGKPVCTRDGRKARIICFNAKRDAPIIALVTTNYGKEIPYDYSLDGLSANSENEDNDLMMLREKHEGWVNVFKTPGGRTTIGCLHPTREEAVSQVDERDVTYVTTTKIEWEE